MYFTSNNTFAQNLTLVEPIEQDNETHLGRLRSLLEPYGCDKVRMTNTEPFMVTCHFPEGDLTFPVAYTLIHSQTVDWVEIVIPEIIHCVQDERRRSAPELNNLQEYGEALRRLGPVSYIVTQDTIPQLVIDCQYQRANSMPIGTTLTATFREGDIEQRIDPARVATEGRDYLGLLWSDMCSAYQILVGNHVVDQCRGLDSIERIDGTRRYNEVQLNFRWGGNLTVPDFSDQENANAKDLLLSCLTGEQTEQLKLRNGFIVTGGSSGERYWIGYSRAYNVTRQSDQAQLCAGPADRVPTYDLMLAQKLLIENDEQLFLEKANIRGGDAASAWEHFVADISVDTQSFPDELRGYNNFLERIGGEPGWRYCVQSVSP